MMPPAPESSQTLGRCGVWPGLHRLWSNDKNWHLFIKMAFFWGGGQNVGFKKKGSWKPNLGQSSRRRASWRCDRISAQGAAWWHPLRSRCLENYGLYKGNLEQCASWEDIEPGSLGFHFLSPRCFESLLMPFVAPEDGIRMNKMGMEWDRHYIVYKNCLFSKELF